jgi:post-segregation antitoxin (ccd killing protein)
VALQLDIKANDAFERSALAAAAALEKVAAREKQVDAYAQKLAGSYQKAAGYAAKVGGPDGKAAGAKPANKDLDAQKKKTKEGKKFSDYAKKAYEGGKTLALTLAASAASALALGAALGAAAKNSYETRRNSSALVDAFTGGQGPKVLAQLDNLATKLGMTIDETRSKFVEFRQAGFQSQQAAALIKMRADLQAVGLSAEAADKEIGYVLSKADGHSNAAAMRQLQEISRAYRGIGSGAVAAGKSNETIGGAMAKLSNTATTALAKLWEKIGPDIGKAANRLADFVTKLIDSEAGKKALDGIAAGFKNITEAINEKTLTKAVSLLKEIGAGLSFMVKPIDQTVGKSASQLDAAVSALDRNDVVLAERAKEMGIDISKGIAAGIEAKKSEAARAATGAADATAGAFAETLGIQSPSKVFMDYGRQTVAGYEIGQREAIGEMPIQAAAARAPAQRPAAGGGGSITIEQLIVQGGGNAHEIGTAIRQQLQLLLQAGALSRGIT